MIFTLGNAETGKLKVHRKRCSTWLQSTALPRNITSSPGCGWAHADVQVAVSLPEARRKRCPGCPGVGALGSCPGPTPPAPRGGAAAPLKGGGAAPKFAQVAARAGGAWVPARPWRPPARSAAMDSLTALTGKGGRLLRGTASRLWGAVPGGLRHGRCQDGRSRGEPGPAKPTPGTAGEGAEGAGLAGGNCGQWAWASPGSALGSSPLASLLGVRLGRRERVRAAGAGGPFSARSGPAVSRTRSRACRGHRQRLVPRCRPAPSGSSGQGGGEGAPGGRARAGTRAGRCRRRGAVTPGLPPTVENRVNVLLISVTQLLHFLY